MILESPSRKIAVLAEGLKFPEGPAFAADGSLWLVELKGESLVQIKDNTLKKYPVGGKPNGIAIDQQGNVWFCDSGRNEVRCFYPRTGGTETMVRMVDLQDLDAPNDLAFDSEENLVFTCPGNSRKEPGGYVCVRQKNGKVKKITEGMYFPNGLAFSGTGSQLIIAETYKQRLWKGEWDSKRCEWIDPKVFYSTKGPIGPDGMAFDSSENLYVAVYGTGKVEVLNMEGQPIDEIALPGSNPTNCALDPTEKLGMVVTEAENGLLLSFGTDCITNKH